MMRHIARRLVNWGAFGRIEDDLDVFDDYRRRVEQETATLRRIGRLRRVAWLRRKKAARHVTAVEPIRAVA